VRTLLWLTVAAALATFCVVQDRVTAEGARRYVALQKEALAGGGRLVTVDDVMRPAVDRSVRLALLSSGVVAVVGVAAAFGGRALHARRVRPRGPHA
jgi:hypothetical protein